MKKVTTILVVLNRGPGDAVLLRKALRLAHDFDAQVELFSCDSEHEYMLQRAYDKRGVAAARRALVSRQQDYLREIAEGIAAQNLTVSLEAVCESPLYEGIVHKVQRSRPDLVMKATSESSDGPSALGANDWQLARTCPAPLLLSLGRRWPARPRIAAVVDVSAEETPGLARRILRAAEYLKVGAAAHEIEVLHDEPSDVDTTDRAAHQLTLRSLGEELKLNIDRIRLLTGDPATTLPVFAAEQRYDVLVLGALTHRPHLTELVGTLTRKLLDTLHCDFLLIRPEGFVSPLHGPRRQPARMSADALVRAAPL
jgi:universal stress protein E